MKQRLLNTLAVVVIALAPFALIGALVFTVANHLSK
jgi:hypothetical protein